jgi:hypothetical protein
VMAPVPPLPPPSPHAPRATAINIAVNQMTGLVRLPNLFIHFS